MLDRFKILVSANDHKVKITRNKAYTGLPKTELSWKQVIESLHIACRVGNLELLSTLISTGIEPICFLSSLNDEIEKTIY